MRLYIIFIHMVPFYFAHCLFNSSNIYSLCNLIIQSAMGTMEMSRFRIHSHQIDIWFEFIRNLSKNMFKYCGIQSWIISLQYNGIPHSLYNSSFYDKINIQCNMFNYIFMIYIFTFGNTNRTGGRIHSPSVVQKTHAVVSTILIGNGPSATYIYLNKGHGRTAEHNMYCIIILSESSQALNETKPIQLRVHIREHTENVCKH